MVKDSGPPRVAAQPIGPWPGVGGPSGCLLPPAVERLLGQQLAGGGRAAQQLQAAQESGVAPPLALRGRLRVQVQTGEQARPRLILACAPLVERLARQY